MPELPDLTIYVEALRARTVGATLLGIRVFGPSRLRGVEPRLVEAEVRRVRGTRRLGKRIVCALDGDFFAVLRRMIARRLRWRAPRHEPTDAAPASRRSKYELGALDFSTGTLVATETGARKRATLYSCGGDRGARKRRVHARAPDRDAARPGARPARHRLLRHAGRRLPGPGVARASGLVAFPRAPASLAGPLDLGGIGFASALEGRSRFASLYIACIANSYARIYGMPRDSLIREPYRSWPPLLFDGACRPHRTESRPRSWLSNRGRGSLSAYRPGSARAVDTRACPGIP